MRIYINLVCIKVKWNTTAVMRMSQNRRLSSCPALCISDMNVQLIFHAHLIKYTTEKRRNATLVQRNYSLPLVSFLHRMSSFDWTCDMLLENEHQRICFGWGLAEKLPLAMSASSVSFSFAEHVFEDMNMKNRDGRCPSLTETVLFYQIVSFAV